MRVLLILLLSLTFLPLKSQGIYIPFGQNTCGNNLRSYSLTQDQIEIIYFNGGEALSKLSLQIILKELPELENRLGYNISNGLKLVVFNHYEDFKNSPVNITDPQLSAFGYSAPGDNSAYIYFNGSRINLRLQIRQAITEILISEYIYGTNLKERIQTAPLLNLPDWFSKGLVAYLAENWNIQNDNYLKDFFQNNKQKYFSSLKREDEILAGHSIWRFIEDKFGKSAVSRIMYMTKVTKSVETALIYITGSNVAGILSQWEEYYLETYRNDELEFKFPAGQEFSPGKFGKKQNSCFRYSPDGKYIALVLNESGKFAVVLCDVERNKMQTLYKGGHILLNRNITLSYPIIAWSQDSKSIYLAEFSESGTGIRELDLQGKERKLIPIKLRAFITDMSLSPTGDNLVLSAFEDGQSDLWLYNLKTNQSSRITQDIYDDLNPRFSTDGKTVYFSSNQFKGEQKSSSYYAIYSVTISEGTKKYLCGFQSEHVNCYEPNSVQKEVLSFLCDRNGIVNSYVFSNNSGDKEGELLQMTNYKRSIIHSDVAYESRQVADLLYFNNRYRFYIGVISEDFRSDAIHDAGNTTYRDWLNRHVEDEKPVQKDSSTSQSNRDSLEIIQLKDTLKPVFITGFHTTEKYTVEAAGVSLQKDPFVQISTPHFGVNFSLTQLDNSLLGNYLLPGGLNERIFLYPFLSPHIQTSLKDVLNNHLLIAGVRVPLRTKASDFYLHWMNRTGRWDKELSLYRRGRILENFVVPIKMISSGAKYAYNYPFNERARVELSVFGRNDRNIRQAIDSTELKSKLDNRTYAGFGFSYVFDNVRSNGLNLFEGLRFRFYNENYFRSENGSFTSNTGLDFRYYRKLHRQIYLACRLSGAYSEGSARTAYYMGGVENWITNVDSNKVFNYNIPTLRGSEYAFQTIVAPMRGFLRNTRAGDKYVLANIELRIPVFRYLIQKPISSEFFKSIMLTGFVDAGTAWKGSSPYSLENPFNTQLVSSSQYQITVISQRNPFIVGTGFGIRARIMRHYIKYDYGWGLVERKFNKGFGTFSLGLDF